MTRFLSTAPLLVLALLLGDPASDGFVFAIGVTVAGLLLLAMTPGLVKRKKVLISFSSARVETRGAAGSWSRTSSSRLCARALSGSRSRV